VFKYFISSCSWSALCAMKYQTQREHEQRYEYAPEWIDVLKMVWSDKDKKLYGLNASGRSGSARIPAISRRICRQPAADGSARCRAPSAMLDWGPREVPR